MLVSYAYRITEFYYTYGNATLSAHYVGYLYFHNYWFTLHIWVSNLNAICASVLLGLSNEDYVLGDFRKISLGAPFALFQKMRA